MSSLIVRNSTRPLVRGRITHPSDLAAVSALQIRLFLMHAIPSVDGSRARGTSLYTREELVPTK
jgi:hypothetical protein